MYSCVLSHCKDRIQPLKLFSFGMISSISQATSAQLLDDFIKLKIVVFKEKNEILDQISRDLPNFCYFKHNSVFRNCVLFL